MKTAPLGVPFFLLYQLNNFRQQCSPRFGD